LNSRKIQMSLTNMMRSMAKKSQMKMMILGVRRTRRRRSLRRARRSGTHHLKSHRRMMMSRWRSYCRLSTLGDQRSPSRKLKVATRQLWRWRSLSLSLSKRINP